MGVPAQRTSMPVVWPLQRGVSRHTSASCPLLTCSSFGATGEKMMREPGSPMFWAYCWMLGSPTAGKRRSHKTLLGTRFRICREDGNSNKFDTPTNRTMSSCDLFCPTHVGPHLESGGINLIELVEIAVDNRVLWETILGAGCHDDCSWHLLPRGSFVVDLQWAETMTNYTTASGLHFQSRWNQMVHTCVVARPLLTVKLLIVTWIWPWLIMLMIASAAVFMGITGMDRAPLASPTASWLLSHFIWATNEVQNEY